MTVLLPAAIQAAERSFIGNLANWSVAANWSDGAVPGAGDTGIIAGASGSPRTAYFDADLAGPPDAIRILPDGELNLYSDHMTTEHNLILEGGRLSTRNWYNCYSTISLRADSRIGANGTSWFYLRGVIQDDGPSAGRLMIDNSLVQIINPLNSYSGGTQIGTNATLHLASGANLVGTGPLEIQPGGRLYYGYMTPGVTLTNPIVVHDGKLHGWNNLHYLTAPGGIRVQGAVELYTTASPQGLHTHIHDYDAAHTGRVVKTGSGIYYFFAAMSNSTYSGGTRIEAGDIGLQYNANNVLGTGPVEVLPGGRLTFINNNTETNLVILNGGEIATATGNPYAKLPLILIKGTGTISSKSPNYFHLTGSIADYDASTPGQLIIRNESAGPLTLVTSDKHYSGGTHIQRGLLVTPRMPDAGMIRIDTNATLKLTTASEDTLGGLSGGGSLDLGTVAVTCAEGLRPGVEVLAGSTLCVTGSTGRVILGPGAVSTFRLRSPGDQDQVVFRGGAGLTLGGDVRIEPLEDVMAVGDYTLCELPVGAAPTGAFANLLLPDGYTGRIVVVDNVVMLRLARLGTAIILR